MELWNSLPDNLSHIDLSLGQFRRVLKTHLFWRSLRRIFILVRWLYNLLTYLIILQNKQLKQYIIFVQNCSRCIESDCFKHKTSSAAGGFAPRPPPRALPTGPPLGAPPPDPHYRLALPRLPWVCVWPHFYLPSAAPDHWVCRRSNRRFRYLIIRNAEASLVGIESRDRHYKRILLLLRAHGCNMNVNRAFFHIILQRRFLRLKSGIK